MSTPIVMRKTGSNHVLTAGYAPERRAFRVRFPDKQLSSRTYEYHEVPQELVDAFWASASKGSFIQRVLRDKFPTVLLFQYPWCVRCPSEESEPANVATHFVEVRRNDNGLAISRGVLCPTHAAEIEARTLRLGLTQYVIPFAETYEDDV